MIPFLLSALLLTGDAAATAGPAPATAVAEAPKAERKICKREQVSTSLHGSKRVCMTAAEWKAHGRNERYDDMGSVTTKTSN